MSQLQVRGTLGVGLSRLQVCGTLGVGLTYGYIDSKKSPYPLRNCNHASDSADDAVASLKDADPPNYIIDPKLKCKIEPRSIIK